MTFADSYRDITGHAPLGDFTTDAARALPDEGLSTFAEEYAFESRTIAVIACGGLADGRAPDRYMAFAREAARLDRSLLILRDEQYRRAREVAA